MRILGVEIVIWTIQIRGHCRNRIEFVLQSISLAHFNPSNLGNRVPFVRGLQRSRQQRAFGDGLGGEFGIDARGAEEEEFLDAMGVGGSDDVGLDLEVDGDEIGWVGVVGVDAADFRGGEDDVVGLLGGEEGVNGGLGGEVELGMGPEEEVCEA